ncbi:hypothetical protein [Paraclostridium sordellii]|uniref:hypothetical protein n=1 Tax=Paraclostridium sordellii TaxID=1505 RepID=UPI0005E8DDCB|nr:hypothetical protein [Paeniclostridium sordellii]CEQ00311.1 Uncharacterised protein [[Clostridium] sordellii] [Paeniclostridium sordellii]
MSITESVIEFIEMVNRICQEQGLDIKEIIDKKDEFYEVFKEAGRRFDDINKQIDDSCSCKKCKKHETNIKDVEVLCNRKKADWEGKGNLIKDGVVIGLEMALTMLK